MYIAGLDTSKCPLWKTPATMRADSRYHSLSIVVDSDRAGGQYVLLIHIARNLQEPSNELSNEAKAQITTRLVDRRREGTAIPEITRELVERARSGDLRSLLPSQKADLLLRRLAQEVPNVGEPIDWPKFAAAAEVAACCEAETIHEVKMLLQYLRELHYAAQPPNTDSTRELMLTAQGYQRIAELEMSGIDSNQIFVAMWFHDTINRLYHDAIKVAIEEAGYTPYRVDKPSHEDKDTYEMKVCDRIEVEIRRSRMVIADFTHGDAGARGGVYFEAGLARGLGIPVIWSCSEDMFDELHFDTRQYPHIGWQWNKLHEFKQELSDRIQVVAQTT